MNKLYIFLEYFQCYHRKNVWVVVTLYICNNYVKFIFYGFKTALFLIKQKNFL